MQAVTSNTKQFQTKMAGGVLCLVTALCVINSCLVQNPEWLMLYESVLVFSLICIWILPYPVTICCVHEQPFACCATLLVMVICEHGCKVDWNNQYVEKNVPGYVNDTTPSKLFLKVYFRHCSNCLSQNLIRNPSFEKTPGGEKKERGNIKVSIKPAGNANKLPCLCQMLITHSYVR